MMYLRRMLTQALAYANRSQDKVLTSSGEPGLNNMTDFQVQ